MRTRTTIALGVLAVAFLSIMGVLVFAAGGIVARHHITPLVAVVDAAEANAKSLMKSLKGESDKEEYLTSAYYHLKRTTYNTSETGAGDNVGLAPVSDGYLIAQRAGSLKFARIEDNQQVFVQSLVETIPTNKDLFLKSTEGMNPRLHVQFGVKDIFIQPGSEQLKLYASHHYWHKDDQCWTMRLSLLQTSVEQLLVTDAADSGGEWQTVYDSQPCAKLGSKPDHNNEDNTYLHAGGRLDLLDENHMLMTIGDHYLDGQHNVNLIQDPNTSYGKIMLLDLQANTARMFSMGHRNPQGLYVDDQGNVWATEQGPRGGDELNFIEEGNNYGWPLVSYGTDYVGVTWPEQFNWASHEGSEYVKPIWSWVPSIAANNLIRLEGSAFPLWEGNMIVASLKNQGIHRVMLAEGRAIAVERIHIGSRVRDLTQTANGELLLLTDDGKLVLIKAMTDENDDQLPLELQASRLWVQCDSCHLRNEAGGHSAGPNLHDIVGSEIARFDDYNYTDALKKLEGRWTPEKLDAFLSNPQEFAPGTAMAFPGFDNPEDRQLLIQYLQSGN